MKTYRGIAIESVKQKYKNVNVLVAGANGFIGKNLCALLRDSGFFVVAAVRDSGSITSLPDIQIRHFPEVVTDTNLVSLLEGIDCVVHCVGISQSRLSFEQGRIDELMDVNVGFTKSLATQAASVGIKRFVFLSSIKVNGENTSISEPFTNKSCANPQTAYALSKNEAEIVLNKISKDTGMEIVIVRPPLVYGPGVRGNMHKIIKAIGRGVPLPFMSIHNKRSFIYVGNLIDVLALCVSHPKAAGKTLLVSDDGDYSTAEFLQMISEALEQPLRLFPFPGFLITILGKMFGRENQVGSLTKSLRVDCEYTRQLLEWTPSVTTENGLKKTVERE